MREPFIIGERHIMAGDRAVVELPLPRLYTHTPMTMPVHVVHAKRDGPRLFVSAAIHGDELNGVEIIRRLLASKRLASLRGTLVAVPIVNAYGVLNHSRYLPDRRDLNRSFPGSDTGSMAARLAHVFMTEIVARCTHGIDLHTGAIHRDNLPQIRANLGDPETDKLAHVFGVPVLLDSSLRDGSLREAAAEHGVRMLLYEAGEALRLDEVAIRGGLRGIVNVMRAIGMLPASRKSSKPEPEPFIARSSLWLRAPESGLFRTLMPLGAKVKKGDVLGIVNDPFSGEEHPVASRVSGIIIGRTHLPLVHEGEALFHVARFQAPVSEVAEQVEAFHANHLPVEGEPGGPIV
jgi:predicted deacylase